MEKCKFFRLMLKYRFFFIDIINMYLAEDPHHMTSKDWQLKHLSTGNAYEGMLAPSSYLHTASVIIFKLNW